MVERLLSQLAGNCIKIQVLLPVLVSNMPLKLELLRLDCLGGKVSGFPPQLDWLQAFAILLLHCLQDLCSIISRLYSTSHNTMQIDNSKCAGSRGAIVLIRRLCMSSLL